MDIIVQQFYTHKTSSCNRNIMSSTACNVNNIVECVHYSNYAAYQMTDADIVAGSDRSEVGCRAGDGCRAGGGCRV